MIDDAWTRIGNDPELKRARRKLSLHELRLIIRHAQGAALGELTAARVAPEPVAKDWLDDFDGDKPIYTDRELIDLLGTLLQAQVREQRINSIEELQGMLRHIGRSQRAALASPSIASPEREEGWQRIETAPKDGTRILASGWAWGDEASGQRVENLVHWDGEDWSTAFPGDPVDNDNHVYPPTHWRPLPEPPRALTGKQKP